MKPFKDFARLIAGFVFLAVSQFAYSAITPPSELTVYAAPGEYWEMTGGTATKDFSGCPVTGFIVTGYLWRLEVVETGRTGNWGINEFGGPQNPFGYFSGGWLQDPCSNPSVWSTGGMIPLDAEVGSTYSFRIRNVTAYTRAFYGTTTRMNELSSFTMTVVVVSSNQPPVASNRTLTVAEDTAGTVTLLATDVDGDALTYSVVTAPNSAH
ncbi:hypothetical protein R2571_005687, partial [Pseudomonas aeruginosa]|nr:hypothetical protein [Pseudomonas aeruginosa]